MAGEAELLSPLYEDGMRDRKQSVREGERMCGYVCAGGGYGDDGE